MSAKFLENATKFLLIWRGYFQEIVWIMWSKVWANWGLLLQTQLLQGIAWRGRRDLNPRPPA